MELAAYMSKEDIDDAEMGRRTGRSRVTISRYRRKLETPSSEAVIAIVGACGGEVTADELLGIKPNEAAPHEVCGAAP